MLINFLQIAAKIMTKCSPAKSANDDSSSDKNVTEDSETAEIGQKEPADRLQVANPKF